MSQQYPYIQTLQDIDPSVNAYDIQPISGDETEILCEETPVLAFGPLGRINIFVGATNAGKSRFLRTLARCQSYSWLPSEEIHAQIHQLITSATFLANSDGSLIFEVTYGAHEFNHYGTQTSLDRLWPNWAKKFLGEINYGSNFQERFDSQFFESVQEGIRGFLAEKLSGKNQVSSASTFGMGDEIAHAKIVCSLLNEEISAREKDAKGQIYNQSTGYREWQSLEKRTNPELFKFDFSGTDADWQKEFLTFWQMVEALSGGIPIKSVKPSQRIYIPTLRSAVSLRGEDGARLTFDVFKETVIQNYNLQESNIEIFTGNRLYDTLKRDRNGTPEVVARLRDFEKFLSTSFYDGRKVEIVAIDEKYNDGEHISVWVDKDTPRELHHLGDGVNTLIILLYQLFMADPGSWVFIEEPELNLHPGLQRLFLQTLIENEALQKRNLRVFFTTHSNHLLRMTMRDGTIASEGISIFAFQQRESEKDRFLIRPLVSEQHHALALLGVQNASVLLAQCGIWVEGVTDRQYLRAYLNAYQNSLEFKKEKRVMMREDTHFAFWEYAGSNLAHYLMDPIPHKNTPEAEDYEVGKKDLLAKIQSSALCNRIFLLADRDEKKTQKHRELNVLAHGHSNFAYFVTQCVEIENLLSPSEFMQFLPDFLKNSTDPVKFSFVQSDYKNIRIGTFLSKNFRHSFPRNWKTNSGTLATPQKTRLCELAVKHISWDTMSKESKKLTKTLYNFIAMHNDI